ncbi:MAG: acyl-CoA/acyl-ACP dehydrogenase [Myxococcales bacterium]|nr:acyl-CoA/acyl-ACP dehydrogenase [Myxococcales bacterium]
MSEIDLLRESVRRFAREVVGPTREALNHFPERPLPAGIVSGLGELGLFDAEIEPGLVSAALEELAKVAAAPAALVLTHAVARALVREAGGGRSAALGGLNGHGIFACPIYSELDLTDGAPSLRRIGAEIELEGTAQLVVGAPLAKVLVLPVRDAAGWALVGLETSEPGVVLGEPLLTLGMRGCPTADVSFQQRRFPADRVLATSPEVVRRVARRFRGAAVAISAGILASSVQAATEYAQERYQGGGAIIEHQEVRAILGRMLEDLAVCQDSRELLERDTVPEWRALAAFLRAKERAAHATSDGVQLLGGNGYMEDYGQERAMRDAKQAQFLFGRTDVARQALAGAVP